MRRFLHTWLTVIVAVCFGINGYANDYKKETKIIPGVVFKSDKKVKDKTPSGMGILSLTQLSQVLYRIKPIAKLLIILSLREKSGRIRRKSIWRYAWK